MVQIRRSRKQRTDAAIAYALARRWDEAAAENRALVEEFPDDLEAANRLGKALQELGDLDGAAEAYQRTIEFDATNIIAKRNLARIEELRAAAPKARKATGGTRRASKTAATPNATPAPVRPHSLIEESGRSAEFVLQETDAEVLSQVAAGDPGDLVPTARGIAVHTAGGALLGHLEPRAGLRLRRLMEGGNTYTLVIRGIAEGETTVYIRETFRSPNQLNEPSFLPPPAARRRLAPRAYTKSSSIVRYQGDDGTDEEGDGDDSWTPRGGGSNSSDDDEMEDNGFGDAGIGDDDEDDMDGLGDDDDDGPMADEDDDE